MCPAGQPKTVLVSMMKAHNLKRYSPQAPSVDLEDELGEMKRAIADLDREDIADAIQAIGFECTDCGACCRGEDEEHIATVFPDEARRLHETESEAWRDVVRPMPFGVDEDGAGTTIEWSLQTSSCGNCRFLEMDDSVSHCTRYANRPSICRTYPFTLVPSPESPPQGDAVAQHGVVQAHECEGLGRDIERERALDMADELIERGVKSVREAEAVREHLKRLEDPTDGTIVVDSEGYKQPDGSQYSASRTQR